jgi:hypothetical protein
MTAWLSPLLVLTIGVTAAQAAQPIEFPHNKHILRGLECIDCHSNVDSGAEAGIPSVRKCMLCHTKLFNKGPGVQQVLSYAKQKREIPWQRVYGFEPGAAVKFQHAPHIWAKIECKTCHGDVANMTVVQPVVSHNMGTCLTCHRQNHATQDCAACHY